MSSNRRFCPFRRTRVKEVRRPGTVRTLRRVGTHAGGVLPEEGAPSRDPETSARRVLCLPAREQKSSADRLSRAETVPRASGRERGAAPVAGGGWRSPVVRERPPDRARGDGVRIPGERPLHLARGGASRRLGHAAAYRRSDLLGDGLAALTARKKRVKCLSFI